MTTVVKPEKAQDYYKFNSINHFFSEIVYEMTNNLSIQI